MDIHRLLSPSDSRDAPAAHADQSVHQTRYNFHEHAFKIAPQNITNDTYRQPHFSTQTGHLTSRRYDPVHTAAAPPTARRNHHAILINASSQTINNQAKQSIHSAQLTTRLQQQNPAQTHYGSMNTSPKLAKTAPRRRPPSNRTLSSRSLTTVTMDEAPSEMTSPREFMSDSMSQADLSQVTELLTILNQNSYAYQTHVQLINLLHAGFTSHVQATGADDAASYSLLSELRQAREAMDSRFAVGEKLWLDWLADEILLAQSSESRLAVTELCQRAVQEEPYSVPLWKAYVGWIHSNFRSCYDLPGATQSEWTEEDKEVCKELFTEEMALDVVDQAMAATKWRIDSSHLFWDNYLTNLQARVRGLDLDQAQPAVGPPVSLAELEQRFLNRLQTPHLTIENTMQVFWPIVSKIHGKDWEVAMGQLSEMMADAKAQTALRQDHESSLQQAIDAHNEQQIVEELTKYLRWEKQHKQRSSFDDDLRCALFERALLLCPTQAEWWLEYIDFVISRQPSSHNPSSSILPLIERATRHCPWSGELWSRRILRSDIERRPYDDIEATKHRATNSGLLDVGGMEDLLKVLVEWCSYLRRHAFSATSTEDDKDTAEVGITMAIEDVEQAGKRLYGKEFGGDPLFRLENIQIKFLSEARRYEDARAVWQSLVSSKKGSYEFWQKYYTFELALWAHYRANDGLRVETTETGPIMASNVLEAAISQRNLDWPEKVLEMYTTHYQQHESVEKLQAATITAQEFKRKIAAKRAREAEEAAASAQESYAVAQEDAQLGNKRRRVDDDAMDTDDNVKKVRQAELSNGDTAEPSTSGAVQAKRDREHLTLTVSNLAAEIAELDIRKFFRDCGTIKSVDIAPSKDESTSATVEFESKEDVATAKTRNGKSLLGREIYLRSGSQSTLYVANYPPEYNEGDIRRLFSSYGEVISVRFPSLKFNNRRRFCYVTFLSNEQAKAAESAMDNKLLDGSHKLLAKISDPDAKKQRSGAQAEGREIFVKNLDNAVSEDEIKHFFAQYGQVESMNLLKNIAGKRLGNGFIVFSSADEAAEAVRQAHGKSINDRILNVTLASAKGANSTSQEKAHKKDIVVKHAETPEPNDQTMNGRRDSDVSMQSGPAHQDNESYKTIRERQIAIFNVLDTVSDARITSEMEKHGPIVKIQLRRDQNAAIVEFADVKVAFKVRAAVDCTALGPDARAGDVKDLFNQKKAAADPLAMRPNTVARPGAQRGGRRGGLGFKRGGFQGIEKGIENGGSKARSNADFKAIFAQGKKPSEDNA